MLQEAAEEREEAGDQEEAVTPEDCRVWECRSCDGFDIGFLVSEPGRLDQLIAFVPIMADGAEEKAARREAHEVAENPRCIEVGIFDEVVVVDLRPYGKLDSNTPTPRWLFSTRCRPDGSDLDYDWSPNPYCRFLHLHLIQMKADLMK